jgi:hypothetical protein
VEECKPPAESAGHQVPPLRLLQLRVAAAQVEFESKIEARLKADSHILVSRALFQALPTWV